MACPASVDQSFGPWAGPVCRGGFDFTLLFEESILALPLLCVFLLVLPLRTWQLSRMDVKVVPTPLRLLKAAASICLIGLSTAMLILWARTSSATIVHTRATIATASLAFVASLGVGLLSWLEHDRALRPSFVLFVYLFLSVILDLTRTRTLWLLNADPAIAAVFTTTVVLRAVMLVMDSIEKRNILAKPYRETSAESTRGPLNLTLFVWLVPLFVKGYKNILVLDDLEQFDTKLRSGPLSKALLAAWEKVPNKKRTGIFCLTCFRVLIRPALAAAIPRLFLIGFTYAQPFMVTAAVELADQPDIMPYNNRGYGLIAAYGLVYAGVAISIGQYSWRARRFASMMRASIGGLIYHESLRLDIMSPSVVPTAALTLMSTDIEIIIIGLYQVHELWASATEISIAMYLIYRQLGAACAMPISVAIVVLITTVFIAVPTGKAQGSWIQASQERVSATSVTLGSIKGLKISGLAGFAFETIRRLRTRELEVSLKYRVLLTWSTGILIFAPIWSPILTFSLYAGLGQQGNSAFSFARIFTSYSILTLVNTPLTSIIHTLPTIAGSLASFQRVQNHLNGAKRQDNRIAFHDEKQSGSGPWQNSDDFTATTTTDSRGTRLDHEYSEESFKKPESERESSLSQTTDVDLIASVDGTFSWTEDTEPVITIPDWNIPRGVLTMVLGPVGCGKSTLLKSLLGELSSFKGSIRTNYSGVAYCDQSVWIPNETVRQIIVNGEAFDESWYRTVVKACALEEDLRNWPNGDKTVAGTKGISMSGGQKNRLSIARAIYSKREFLILDDVLSGLDSSTENTIFINLFGKSGLARKANMTTVFASSNGKRVPYADQILLLDEEGHVKGSGRPEELEGKFDVPMSEVNWDQKDEVDVAKESEEKTEKTEKTEVDSASTDVKKDVSRQRGDGKVYKVYAKAAGRRILLACTLSLAAYSVFEVYPSFWLGQWGAAQNPLDNLGKWLGVYVALGVGAVITAVIGLWIIEVVVISHSGVYFHKALLDTVARAPMSFHSTVDSGTTTNRFSQDLRLIDMELPNATFGVATTLLLFLAQLVVAAVSSKYIAVIIPFLVLTLYILQHYYLRTSRQLRLLEIENKAPLYTQFIEALNGVVTIRAFQREALFEDRNLLTLDDSRRPEYMLLSVQCWLNFAIDVIIMLIVIVFVSITTTLRQQIGPSYLGIGLSTVLGFSGSAKTFVTYWVLVEVSLSAISRINGFIASTEVESPPDSAPANLEEMEWPSQGAVELKKVVARYEPSRNCLDDVDLSIEPGQKVAVCGRTGSGKSSLTLCLLRMLDLAGGSITVDGIDIASLPHEYVRSRLVALPQDTFVFDGSVRLNVDPSESIPDDRLITVLEKVQLWAKIQSRGGLDAVANDKFFSPGEAQLLVFARAMLRTSKVLILDEFTSSLDEHTSVIVEQVLRSWFKGWTIIVVAHKLDAIQDFDKVAVLDDGKLLEFDSPEQLMAQDSAFRRLQQAAARQ